MEFELLSSSSISIASPVLEIKEVRSLSKFFVSQAIYNPTASFIRKCRPFFRLKQHTRAWLTCQTGLSNRTKDKPHVLITDQYCGKFLLHSTRYFYSTKCSWIITTNISCAASYPLVPLLDLKTRCWCWYWVIYQPLRAVWMISESNLWVKKVRASSFGLHLLRKVTTIKERQVRNIFSSELHSTFKLESLHNS